MKPRRTIRVALWSGEEQGFNGSREYVKQHFGETKGGGGGGMFGGGISRSRLKSSKARITKNFPLITISITERAKFAAFICRETQPSRRFSNRGSRRFADLGAKTLTILNTGGTDHLSFDAIGLPGFQFIQDEVEYDTRTHHSNQDNFDRIQAEDMKQASTIMAAFVYQTAMMDEKMPRKVMK